MSQRKILEKALTDSCIKLQDASIDDLVRVSENNTWTSPSVWLSYATKLDQSNLLFFLPDDFRALEIITKGTLNYVAASTCSGAIDMFLVGLYEPTQPLGPFWRANFKLQESEMSSNSFRKLKFGRLLQSDLEHGNRSKDWDDSFKSSYDYLTLHRQCVRKMGEVLDVDMADHDLTKTRLVQVSLGYMWHWTGHKADTDHERELSALGRDAITAGHLELENHHPEYTGVLAIEPDKLLTDRVSVHLQKDPPDQQGGWDLNPRFIPPQYEREWHDFREKHHDKDLYELVWKPIFGGTDDNSSKHVE